MNLTISILYYTTYLTEIVADIREIFYSVSSSDYHKTSDQIKEEYRIIEGAKKNPNKFAPIYERYFEEIYLYVYKRIDDEDITADVTSRVFLKCLNNLNRYTFQGVPFSAWLYRIALNEVNQYFRNQKKAQRTVSIGDSHINILFTEIEIDEPEEEPEKIVERLLNCLDQNEVQFLELRFFEERSFKEMGYLLGLTEINAKIKTYRILKKLKRIAEKDKAD